MPIVGINKANHFHSTKRILSVDEKIFVVVYWVPVSVTSQLKVVRLPVFDAAVKVSVA